VDLYDAAGVILPATTVTDSNGQYIFGGLDTNAIYQVHVDPATLPNSGTGLTNHVDPDGGTAHQSVVDLSVDGDGVVLDQDFGYIADTPNTISGTIWDDTNANGTLTDGSGGTPDETGNGLSGVTVILRDDNGNIVGTTVTDSSGDYSFGNLPDGTYTVEVDDQDGSLEGFWHSDGPIDGADNNSQPNGYSVSVIGGVTDSTGDFGYYKKPASVGNLVWNDVDGDGLYEPNGDNGIPGNEDDENGIDNVLVTATITYDNGVTFTVATRTNSNGVYSFDNLLLDEDYNASGGSGQPTYIIQVEPPTGTASTHTPATDAANIDNDADNPEGEFVILTQGQAVESKDFAFYYNGSIGDYVWLDINGDGKQDLNESPLSGVTVKLYRDGGNNTLGGDDTLEGTLITGGDGKYLFENLPAGTYWVQVHAGVPTGLSVTGSHDAGTSDRPADKVVLTDSQQHKDADFGFNATIGTSMLGDTVWFDVDPDGTGAQSPNGIQDPGEVGLSGVTLYICDGDEASCTSGTAEHTVVTNPDGSWLVTGLTPGATYTVSVNTAMLPSGINNTPTNGEVRRVYTMPADGSSLLVADYGFTDNDGTQSYGTIGDRVYQDENGDGDDESGSDPGISGVTVELLNSSGAVIATTVTNGNGDYKFTGLELDKEYKVRIKGDSDILSTMTRTETGPDADNYTFNLTAPTPNKTGANFGFKSSGSDLGDYVWFDENGNGIQDTGETGIGNVEVRLYLDNGVTQGSKDGGDTLIRTVTTDSNGKYLFSGLETDKEYIVEVVPPANFSPSPAGSDTVTEGTVNSDGNAEASVNFTVTTLDIDFGLTGDTYSIGDKVWFDTDGDGTQNESGTGIGDVTIDLYLGTTRIASTVTATDGSYRFDNLPANNNYEVRTSDRNNILVNFISSTGGASQLVTLPTTEPGGHATGINFGWKYPIPTYAVVSSFNTYVNGDNHVVLEWTTASEIGTIGFHLERLNEQSGKYQAVTKKMLPGMLSPPHGGTYRFVDKQAEAGKEYTYRVIEIAAHDGGTVSGPYTVQANQALPLNNNMFADEVEGYTLTHAKFSNKQLRRFAARDVSGMKLESAKKKKTGTTLKVPVSRDGLVYLSAAELASASGLTEKQVGKYVKSKKCLVTLASTSIPVISANTGSGLWFYGRASERNDIGQNIYLLELGEKGVKMKNTPGRAEEIVSDEQSFMAHVKAEENFQPFHLYINTPVQDFWAWEFMMAHDGEYTANHTLDAPYLTGHSPATLTVNLVGLMSSGSPDAVPYKVAVSLNGVDIGTAEWSAVGDYQFRTEVPANLLASSNDITLVSQLNSGINYTLIYLESFELEYEREYQVMNGELTFSAEQYDRVMVKGLSSSNVLALDVTDPDVPVRVRTLPGKNDLGEYTATVRTEPGHEYFITENINSTVAGELLAETPSDLKNSANQADY
ncbi:MAG: hypothetical protein D3916_05800, partial [Candidatus Electrothrix sp. MAN1_4]|nr:hypothetical protein [Candidatus Electrothrix sp. MAN1_4]